MDAAFFSRVRKLSLRTKRIGQGSLIGAYRSKVKGHGLEYLESRRYEAGDDVRHLDWKVSARSGALHTKRFQEERRLRFHIYLDTRASMHFGCQQRSKLETAILATAALSYAAMLDGDEVTVHTFTQQVQSSTRPIDHQQNFWPLVQILQNIQTLPIVTSKKNSSQLEQVPILEQIIQQVQKSRRRPQVICIISDFGFLTTDAQIHRTLSWLKQRADILLLPVVSIRELAWPAKLVVPWRDQDTGRWQQPTLLTLPNIIPTKLALRDDQDVIEGLLRFFNQYQRS